MHFSSFETGSELVYKALCNVTMNDEEGYLLPTIARKITCRRFN